MMRAVVLLSAFATGMVNARRIRPSSNQQHSPGDVGTGCHALAGLKRFQANMQAREVHPFKVLAALLPAFNPVATRWGVVRCGQNIGVKKATCAKGRSAHAFAQQSKPESKVEGFGALEETSGNKHVVLDGADAIYLCKQWIQHHVIRLGLCPFVAEPFSQAKIRYAVSDATTSEELVEDFFTEGVLLLEADPEEIATIMLIAPNYSESIDSFYDLRARLLDLLQSDDEPVLGNRVQPAFFHPEWSFNELPLESPVHFEKRAPTPVISLLRRAAIDAVMQKGLDHGTMINEEISEHNAAALEEEGFERLSSIFRNRLSPKACALQVDTRKRWIINPGRIGLGSKFASGPGQRLFEKTLDNGGSVHVTAHETIEEDESWLPWMEPLSTQEWRVLRLRSSDGNTDWIQSVVKVCIQPPDAPEPLERQRGDFLALSYTETHVAVVLAALQASGAPVLPGTSAETLKILCIGLGGGSVPYFLSENLPHCEVDVAELEPAVLQAASESMGFIQNSRLRVTIQDGVLFAERAVLENADDAGVYDAVLIDAFDAGDKISESLWSSDVGIATALRKGLLKDHGLIAINFVRSASVPVALGTYSAALSSRKHGNSGVSFSVQSEGHGNYIAVQTSASLATSREELEDQLRQAAQQVQADLDCQLDLEPLAVRNLKIYPAEPEADSPRVDSLISDGGWLYSGFLTS